MPQEDRRLKRLIRARMQATGEKYSSARAHILKAATPVGESGQAEQAPRRLDGRKLIETALSRAPSLTLNGLQVEPRYFETYRQQLLDAHQQVEICAEWISRMQLIKSFNTRHTSYGFKHAVERCNPRAYVANGAFIAAALGLGLDYKQDGYGSPNCYFKFAQRTIREHWGRKYSG